jgi:hypothetical protein
MRKVLAPTVVLSAKGAGKAVGDGVKEVASTTKAITFAMTKSTVVKFRHAEVTYYPIGSIFGNTIKRVAGTVDVAREMESVTGCDLVAKEGKLEDVPMLALTIVKLPHVGTVKESIGIVEAKGDEANNELKKSHTCTLTNAPVDERIGRWNVIKKQFKEVEYVSVK